MSLLQIAEPSQSSKPHQHKYALGIDLGTTRSLVAVVRSGKAKVLEADNPANTLLPSVVYYGEADGAKDTESHVHNADCPEDCPVQHLAPIIGQSALDNLSTDPANTIVSAKRFMGRSITDIKFSHPYQLVGNDGQMPSFVTAQGKKTPVAVSADILAVLAKRAKQALAEDSIYGAVITVPAYFDEAQRQATKDAAKVAGINVLRLLNEPTAAAVAYGLDHQTTHTQNGQDNQPQHYLIYDLGGGTFDVSILKLTNGVFEVLATGGNSALGGDDIDRLFANWLIKQAGKDPKAIDNQTKTQLASLARSYKQQLTDKTVIEVTLNLDAISWSGTITQDTLQQIIDPVSRRTIAVCQQVLRDAKLDKSQLDEVVLVGGSTRMPAIQAIVTDFFIQAPLCSIDPDQVVALGAAQAAQQLINADDTDNSLLLLDVTPLSLGLETMGGLTEVLIPRNTPIPVKKRQVFTTYQDGQTGMVVHVVQGERETVEHNRSLAKFTLQGIPAMKAGLARIEVTFSINADGQLTVTAEETTTGTQSQIEVVPSYGLSDEQQEQLLLAGFTHAHEDKEARMLIETQVEAKREILAIESALAEFSSLLNDTQISNINEKMQAVQTAIASNDLSQLITAQAELKPISDTFASLIMNQSVKTSMAGTTAEDWQ